jgi:enoyl reductase-like protein
MNAGYYIKLACDEHYNAKALLSKILAICAKLQKPGLGFTWNVLCINQRQWALRFPMWI